MRFYDVQSIWFRCFSVQEAEGQLSKLVQDPIVSVQNALRPLMKALVSAHLLRNRDSDVRVYVVSCLTEIMRITAPEVPYDDDQMKVDYTINLQLQLWSFEFQ